jgi:hypothetical protein
MEAIMIKLESLPTVPHFTTPSAPVFNFLNYITSSVTTLWDKFFSETPPSNDVTAKQEMSVAYLTNSLKSFFPTGSQIIRRGNTGKSVKNIQTALCLLGYYSCSLIDGVFGSKTDAAVRAFQRRVNIVEDGIVGRNTSNVLIGYLINKNKAQNFFDKAGSPGLFPTEIDTIESSWAFPDFLDIIDTVKPYLLPVAIGGVAIWWITKKKSD